MSEPLTPPCPICGGVGSANCWRCRSGAEWRPASGYEGHYEVSDAGEIRSVRTGLQLALHIDKAGRPNVGLTKDGLCLTKLVSSLVAIAFIGPRPDGLLCCHRDGNPANNSAANLYWGTYADNARDAVRHGTHARVARAACPLGHLLRPPNLVLAKLKAGHRNCLACGRARNRCRWLRAHDLPFDFEEVARQYYADLALPVEAP